MTNPKPAVHFNSLQPVPADLPGAGGETIAPVTLFNAQALKTLSVWEGTITLPADDPEARFRVVVEEYEAFLGDVPEAGLTERFGSGRERRLVYSDAVEVGVV